jgi:hypothetical protein
VLYIVLNLKVKKNVIMRLRDYDLIKISGKIGSGKDTITKMIQYIDMCHQYGLTITENEIDDFIVNYLPKGEKDFPIETPFSNIKYGFALKEILAKMLGVDVSLFEDRIFKEKILDEKYWYYKVDGELFDYLSNKGKFPEDTLVRTNARILIQILGTECGRKLLHPNIWVLQTFAKYEIGFKWVISDARFINEVDGKACYSHLSYKLRVNRPLRLREPLHWSNYEGEEEDFLEYIKEVDEDRYKSLVHDSEIGLDNYDNFNSILENDTTDIKELFNKVLSLY